MLVGERNYTRCTPVRRPVMMSGQIVKCPKCGQAALVKRTVETISYIHIGIVEVKRDYIKPVSASDFCRINVGGKS